MVALLVPLDDTGTALAAQPRPGRDPTDEDIEAAVLAQELGLKVQMEMRLNPDGIFERFAHCRLEGDELHIWQQFMLTRYYERPDPDQQSIKAYRVDLIPKRVLAYWHELKQNEKFERFEIWTTERAHSDPALVGVALGAYFLLARWGNEAPDVLSFEQIEERLRDRELAAARNDNDYFSLMAAWRVSMWTLAETTCFMLLLLSSYALFGWQYVEWQLGLSAALPMIPSMFVAHWILKKLGVHEAVQIRVARKRRYWEMLDRHDTLAV